MHDWTPRLLRALAAGREVVIIDNAGIGESEIAPNGRPTPANYFVFQAATVAGLIDVLGLQQPDLLGWYCPLPCLHLP
jgi:pimeloyl-ACP methyl ester carboxylesterase